MKPINNQLGELGSDGVRHLNSNTAGCPHCGHVDVKFDDSGKLALYHPGAECCVPRVEQQIEWRRAELDEITRKTLVEKDLITARMEDKTWKGDFHAAMQGLHRKEQELKKPIADDLQHAGNRLAELRRTA